MSRGKKPSQTVASAIRALGELEQVDVIIVARGGGSVEDLNVFNAEEVADAIYCSPKPVVSAIGHEINYTIADLVADVRAATPSAAGELVAPVKEELVRALRKLGERMRSSQLSRLEREEMRLGYLAGSGFMQRPERWLQLYQDGLGRLEVKLFEQVRLLYEKRTKDLAALAGNLQALSPLSTLARGYSVCRDKKGKVITTSTGVQIGDPVEVTLYSGSLECIVQKKEDPPNE